MSKHPAHYVGASYNERAEKDFYETPPEATRALLVALDVTGDWLRERSIWEPACGRGAIASVLEREGIKVLSTDIYDHGFKGNSAEGPVDFFSGSAEKYAAGCDVIITNPPYRVKQNDQWRHVEDWIERAFEFKSIQNVFFLLKTTALAGQARSLVMERHLWHMWQFRNRVAMLRDGVPQENMIDFAWYWFRRDTLRVDPTISWIHA